MEWSQKRYHFHRTKNYYPKIVMLLYEDARTRVLTNSRTTPIQHLAPTQALGRYLAEDIYTQQDLPYWNNSAMDGYAIRHEDIHRFSTLTIIEEIPAGYNPQKIVSAGTCSRIFTGAPVPMGADTVVIQENVSVTASGIKIETHPSLGANIRQKGEEFSAGSLIATAGTSINVGLIGLCCALGLQSIPVYRSPKIAVLSTGDELVPIKTQQILHPGQIWSSNNHTLCAAIAQSGGIAIDCGIARDSSTDTKRAFREALSHNPDLILSTGGVSVGDHDRVQEAFHDLGGKLDFWKVRVKPGKPLLMGHIQDTLFLGLPGNPVSALVSYWLFVYPLIKKSMGSINPDLPTHTAMLTHNLIKSHNRAEFIRMKLSADRTKTQSTGNQSSSWISSLAVADALLYIPAESSGYNKGDTVSLFLIPSL